MKTSFKLYQTARCARVIAQLISDGHLQIDTRHLISFYSKNIEEIEEFDDAMDSLFCIRGIIYKDKRGNRFKLFFNSKIYAQLLNELGVPKGNKTNCMFYIPKWIYYGSSEIKRAFLSGVFDAEGYIYSTNQKSGKKRWRIGIEYYKNEQFKESGLKFMEQLRKLLADFEIRSSPVRLKKGNLRKDESKSIGFVFEIEKTSFNNFYKYVGFHNNIKRGVLAEAQRES